MKNVAWRTALAFVVASSLWIFFSEKLLDVLAPDRATVNRWGIYKGWFYVFVTGSLLYAALRRQLARSAEQRQASEEAHAARRASEAALCESEERWQFALEGGDLGVWDWNTETNEVFLSDRWATMLGYEPAEVGRNYESWSSRVHPEDFGPTRELVDRHFRGETPFYESEHRLRAKDGSYRWIRARGKVTARKGDGSPLRIVGTHTDITDWKIATEANRRLVAIVESSDDAIIGTDLQSIVTSWNKGAEQIFGYSAAEMIGSSITRLIAPELESEEEFILGEIQRGESLEHFETQRLTKDGRVIVVSITASPIRDSAGKIIGASKIARDVTERKRAREVIHGTTALLRAVADGTPDAVFVKDREGRYLLFNKGAAQLVGRSVEDVLGRDDMQLFAPEEARELMESDRRVMESGEARMAEEVLTAGDVTRTYLATKAPYRDSKGNVIGLIGISRDITPRKEIEAALALSEERLRLAADAGNVGTWDWDVVTNKIHWSARVWESFGLEPGSVAVNFDLFQSALHPDDRAQVTAKIEAALRGDGHYSTEFRVRQPSGRLVWIAGAALVYRDAQGKPLRVVGTHQDFTERKAAEVALQESEERLRQVLDATLDGVWDWDIPGQRVYFSPQWCRLLGYAPEEVSNDVAFFYSVLHPSDVATVTAALGEHFAGRATIKEGEVRLRTKSGEYRWFLDRGKLVARNEQGEPSRMVGTITDITARKVAEEAMRSSEERYRTLFERAPDGILIGDPESNYLDANPSMCRMLGYTREELVGLNATDIIAPTDAPEIDETIEEIRHGHRHQREWQFRRKDGSIFPVEVIATLTTDGNLLGMVRDISERKQLEAQFLRAQRMEGIGTLAGGIAHDLNNVLAPIMMSLTVLRMRFKDPSSSELLAVIDASAQHGAEMVRQILSFARGMEGRRIEVQLRHLIPEIERIANDTFLKSVQLRSSMPADLRTISGDPTQIHQVLLNLCVNARDAMPNGGVLTISARNLDLDAPSAAHQLEATPGPYVVIEVSDTGTGMAPEVVERIFDPFFTTKDVGKGTGLGLSTSLAIVKSHGGFIRVQSTVGDGTTFALYFPAVAREGAAVAVTSEEAPGGNGELILVVDDEPAVRTITQVTLVANGYRVAVAAGGQEAIEIFAARGAEIAVVLTDMMMPEMDGVATIQALREMSPTVPILAASGLSTKRQIDDVMSLGVKDVLEKPFPMETLLRALKRHFQPKSNIWCSGFTGGAALPVAG
ncbi:MAG: PAS domain S-box protein [Chthoniobacteraceae bacterium]